MDQKQLELERELYQLLLLDFRENTKESLDSLLLKALSLIVEITGARIGYLELRDQNGETWWSTHHCSSSDIEIIRQRISSGIIAEAIECNETIITPSAFLDARFKDRKSVRTGKIEEVLCSPFGDGESVGVIYLQGREGEEAFSARDSMMDTELFTRHITPLLRRLRKQLGPSDDLRYRHDLEAVVGNSPVFQTILREAVAVAELDVPVLIQGESGTGKSLIAKIIHRNSPRSDKPFVHLSCANLPEQLVESELFGAVKGAYSNAYVARQGKIAAAEGGTLFLDEIGELPLSVQPKLLHFLEEGTYYPLGSQILVNADVRILSASNIDFTSEMDQNRFRMDLYYRICVFSLLMPPLNSRTEDIPALVNRFCKTFGEQFNTPGIAFSTDALLLLQESEWPGNIRQLQNQVQRAIVRAKTEGTTVIVPRHLFDPGTGSSDVALLEADSTYREGKGLWEQRFVQARLDKHDWNVSDAARSLGLSRSHMNNLINTHKLQRRKKR